MSFISSCAIALMLAVSSKSDNIRFMSQRYKFIFKIYDFTVSKYNKVLGDLMSSDKENAVRL